MSEFAYVECRVTGCKHIDSVAFASEEDVQKACSADTECKGYIEHRSGDTSTFFKLGPGPHDYQSDEFPWLRAVKEKRVVDAAQVKDVFEKSDAYGDGKLSKDELASIFKLIGNMNDSDFDTLVGYCEIDKDDRLDYSKFIDLVWNVEKDRESVTLLEVDKATRVSALESMLGDDKSELDCARGADPQAWVCCLSGGDVSSVARRHFELLRKARIFDDMADDQIRKLVEISEVMFFEKNDRLIRQGEIGDSLFVMIAGETVTTISEGDDIQEHRKYHKGDAFGELSLILNAPRAATITATTDVEVLSVSKASFEMELGPITQLRGEEYMVDPRKRLANFFLSGDERGPRGSIEIHDGPDTVGMNTSWFAVYRPTSRDAIARMLQNIGVGKGFNVKGKSAKMGKLSGFVPFLQISRNSDKDKVGPSPSWARLSMFFQGMDARQQARDNLQRTLGESVLQIDDPSIYDVNVFSPQFYGLDVPEPLVREAFIIMPDIEPDEVWETGRDSSPAFMNMNLDTLRKTSSPTVVLMQADDANPMNPCSLVIAYAEKSVKAVVSDFDTFTVGSRNMPYAQIPAEQLELAQWSLERTEELLHASSKDSWTSQWLEILTREIEQGFYPKVPPYGFGDPTSYSITESIIAATSSCGAVRHGAECFNFIFPQEMDYDFMIVWDGFGEAGWKYMTEPELRVFLLDRAKEGFIFPFNPVWPVRDPGWYEIYQALLGRSDADDLDDSRSILSWYPEKFGILDTIERLRSTYPNGFSSISDDIRQINRPPTISDMDSEEKRALGLFQAEQTRQKLIQEIRDGTSKFMLTEDDKVVRCVPVIVLKIWDDCDRFLVHVWEPNKDEAVRYRLPGRKLREGESTRKAVEEELADKFSLNMNQIEISKTEKRVVTMQSHTYSVITQYTRYIYHLRLLDRGLLHERQLAFSSSRDRLQYEDGPQWVEFASSDLTVGPAPDADGFMDLRTGCHAFVLRGVANDLPTVYSFMTDEEFQKVDPFEASSSFSRRPSKGKTPLPASSTRAELTFARAPSKANSMARRRSSVSMSDMAYLQTKSQRRRSSVGAVPSLSPLQQMSHASSCESMSSEDDFDDAEVSEGESDPRSSLRRRSKSVAQL